MSSRSGTNVPPTVQPQYYSELIKPTEGHQNHHLPSRGLGGGNYGESSDEVDRFNGGQQLLLQPQQQQMMSGNKNAMKDNQQQTPRSSDFDSYEELYGNNSGAVVGDHKMGSTRKINSNNNNIITNSNSNKPRPDKIQDGVGSFESWDYVYQSLDQDTRRPAAGDVVGVKANGRTSGGGGNGGMSSKEAAMVHNNKTKTMTRQEASKIQEHISNLRAVKPSTIVSAEDAVEGRQRRPSNGGHHQKSNSIGGSSLVANGTGGHHQRQASDSGLNGGHQVASSGRKGVGVASRMTRESEFSVDSLPPPLLTAPGDDQEWSCRFCTFLNENSRRICEMCAKSKDFVLDSSASSATCV